MDIDKVESELKSAKLVLERAREKLELREYAEAEPLLIEAISANQQLYDRRHPDVVQVRTFLRY